MGQKSNIELTDATWNPVTGCTKVSPGCAHCYAERLTERFHGTGSFEKVRLHPERLGEPLRWKKPRMVFTCSMSDLFHKSVPFEFIAEVFHVMENAEQHTFQVLTKRPEWLLRFWRWWHTVPSGKKIPGVRLRKPRELKALPNSNVPYIIPNIWLGTSIENQKFADERIPLLLQVPAAVRFLSVEPMLGPVELRKWLYPNWRCDGCGIIFPQESDHPETDCGAFRDNVDSHAGAGPSPIKWVIVGGESGPGARPMHPDWARAIRDQCVTAGVPFFFKQWGEWALSLDHPRTKAEHTHIAPDGSFHKNAFSMECFAATRGPNATYVMVRVGNKVAGRLLDGREWNEMPKRSKLGAAKPGSLAKEKGGE